MNPLDHTTASPSATPHTSGSWFAPVVELFAAWTRRMRNRRELEMLLHYPESQLRDIGITREQIQAEIRKPFWIA